jgi:O-antigen/teichoic acid export membrane protein
MANYKHMAVLWQHAVNFFTKGHQRSLEAKKNIVGAILVKGISIAISFIMVPLTVHYVNPSKYGVWLTLSSIIGWVSFFDIGFTHGLRNKFAQAKAKGDNALARIYISTTYFYVAIIFISLWLILLFANQFIQWHKLIKDLTPADEADVSRLAMLVFTYFSFQFIFRIINTILTADQQPAVASLLDMLGQLFSLLAIFILTKTTQGSLLYLGLAAGVMPTLVLLFANFFFFNNRFKQYKPSLKFVKKEHAKDIMALGGRFFVLQIAALVQYETGLVLIAYFKGGTDVTNYNIAFKYFAALHMGFNILLSPLWSGVTDAYNTQDTAWIKNAIKKYLFILVPFLIIGIVMLIFSQTVYELWMGKNVVNVDSTVSLLCLVYFATGMFASIFVSVINGIGALRIQFYCSIVACIAFVALALLFIKQLDWGVKSVVAASILTNVFGYIIAPLQVYNIFYKKSKNPIWYK